MGVPVDLTSFAELMNNYKLDDFVHMLGSAMITSRDLSTSDQLEQAITDDAFCRSLGLVLDGLQIACHQFEADSVLLSQLEEFRNGIIIAQS